MKTVCLFLLLLSFTISAQLNKSFGENSFVCSGDGITNKKITLTIHGNDFRTNYMARYSKNFLESDTNYSLKCSGLNGDAALPIGGFEITFASAPTPGVYDLDDLSVRIFFNPSGKSPYQKMYMDGEGSLEITRVDTIGQLIEGTFSGTFTRYNFTAATGLYTATPIKVEITNGKFSAVHYPDFYWNQPASTGQEPVVNKQSKKKK